METMILQYIVYCLFCFCCFIGIIDCFKYTFYLLLYTVGVPIMFVIMIVLDVSRKIFCRKK